MHSVLVTVRSRLGLPGRHDDGESRDQRCWYQTSSKNSSAQHQMEPVEASGPVYLSASSASSLPHIA